MRDPKVIDPPGFDPSAGWKEFREYVDQCGGLADEEGNVNWRAAFGADPGCCTCPNCGEYYWAWGRIIECLDCQFQFPTDWWAMYSWGVQATRNPVFRVDHIHKKRLEHPYYRYGFEHPVNDAWKEHDKLPWKQIISEIVPTK